MLALAGFLARNKCSLNSNHRMQASKDISDTQGQVEFASASLQTALTNIDASTATISPDELDGIFGNILGNLASQPAAAAQLQAANISPSLLSLLQE